MGSEVHFFKYSQKIVNVAEISYGKAVLGAICA